MKMRHRFMCILNLVFASLFLINCNNFHNIGSGTSLPTNIWTWKGGADTVRADGVYGTLGVPSQGNIPSSRFNSATWTDSSGNFWLFGGELTTIGLTSPAPVAINDLWEYNPITAAWTWVNGSNTPAANGVYGTLGTPAPSNTPGARYGAASWYDTSNNFWLFGGFGFDSTGALGSLNDLWAYNLTTNEWTWVGGANTISSSGVYGTLGTPATNNVPGARNASTFWTDTAGNFWLFGGNAYDSVGTNDAINDLWKFNTTTRLWTWVSGSNTVRTSGIYGVQGKPTVNTVPGARSGASPWVDASGNLWLFGGYAFDSTGTRGTINDLWKYSPSSNEWTWINGSNTKNASGVYGTQGIATTTNVPGSRLGASTWIDASNNFWLFGGEPVIIVMGTSTSGTNSGNNDLWEYIPSANAWAWISGSTAVGASGVYGTLGIATAGNTPGGRYYSPSWTDTSRNFWLFGGNGRDSAGSTGTLNDLWKYSTP